MFYRTTLAACTDKEVGAAVQLALDELFDKEHKLLVKDAHERTIAAKFAEYLRPHFPDYDVNVEYDKMGDAPKRLRWRADGDPDPDLVYPDVIVHRVGQPDNLLVVEMKKDSSGKSKENDILKLQAFREDPQFRYQHALFMRFGVGEKGAGTVSECQWV